MLLNYSAILEKFACLPSCSSSVHDLISTRKSTFYEDRYAHTALSNWAYRFDLSEWSRNFDIVEVSSSAYVVFINRDESEGNEGCWWSRLIVFSVLLDEVGNEVCSRNLDAFKRKLTRLSATVLDGD